MNVFLHCTGIIVACLIVFSPIYYRGLHSELLIKYPILDYML